MFRFYCVLLLLVGLTFSARGQTPFTCEGQVWIIQESDNALLQMRVKANNSIGTSVIKNNIGVQVLAMGFRPTDRMLYGLHPLNRELYRIDVDGNVETLATLALDPSLVYLAGDVTPDGEKFTLIGSENGLDRKLVTVNLASGNYEIEETPFDFGTQTVDFSFHPITGVLHGFDGDQRRFYTHNLGTTTIDIKAPIFREYNVRGIYFDAFGNMFGIGTALFGSISGLYNVEPTTGAASLISTSGLIPIGDLAGCPYSLELDIKITPEVTLPCADITFEYAFANQTGDMIQEVTLDHQLPTGYTFKKPTNVPFGGTLEPTSDNHLRINNLRIFSGIQRFLVEAYVDDIPKAIYKSQATLTNVPSEFGEEVTSNDPVSPAMEDSTRMEINRFDEDSLSFANFLCDGSSLTLDASDYGNNLTWSNGATAQQIDVYGTGEFSVVAASGCEDLYVSYEVVAASCPFTIELRHMVQPNVFTGCSEVLFRYILENDSGEERLDVIVLDTLPDGFSFSKIVRDPYGGEMASGLSPNIIRLENLLLHQGIDTIDILVAVGDVPFGKFQNKAQIKGLPVLLGESRPSDDPATQSFPDSTSFFVKAVDGDSLQIDTFICQDTELILDASLYGDSYLWEDGTSENYITASSTGVYEVFILDGCDTSLVNFNVEAANEINVAFAKSSQNIHQSESIQLQPFINNFGDSLSIIWDSIGGNSLSCLDCPQPIATPLTNTIYTIRAANEHCVDSAMITIQVDETRRIFIPAAFSPNNDGINDFFFFQNPDPAQVLLFQVYDRWGSLVFSTTDMEFNQEATGWDGFFNSKAAPIGVYIWQAEIQFFDGKKERLSGEVTVVR